ncbi:hypothetical protein LL936_03540 [Levilactobacillus brevis]|uniref:hypothetical protein n=1 Tax=Levilactobacillus brevis TaxID=1580 RepID=UPI001F2FE14B|nr:hypothetical protein [Levilactobacillus brevis]MCE6037934.1 hypothetical protein [Levilactobacillus brevis]
MSTESRYRYTGEPLEDLSKWATRAARVPEQAVIDDALAANVATLSDLQSRLYARNRCYRYLTRHGHGRKGWTDSPRAEWA